MSVSGFEPNATVSGCTHLNNKKYNIIILNVWQSWERTTNGPPAQTNKSQVYMQITNGKNSRASVSISFERPELGNNINEWTTTIEWTILTEGKTHRWCTQNDWLNYECIVLTREWNWMSMYCILKMNQIPTTDYKSTEQPSTSEVVWKRNEFYINGHTTSNENCTNGLSVPPH